MLQPFKTFVVLIISTLLFNTLNAQKNFVYVYTVAKDGSGDFKFIQDAINACRVYPLKPITIKIKNGVYVEKIEIPATNTDIILLGQNVDSTIISFSDYSGRGHHTTFTSFTAKIGGDRFRAENITFANTAGRVGQAVALHVEANKAVFKNCKFLGNQDTIFGGTEESNQYFENCMIEGTTDFIFGPSTMVFNNCTIRSKSNSYITAASTAKDKAFGLVFLNCKLVADSGVSKVLLGRPWRSYAKTAFINCDFGNHIAPIGWNNWGNMENETTTTYVEYNNTGNSANTAQRAKWAKQLTDKEAKAYTLENIFKTGKDQIVWYK